MGNDKQMKIANIWKSYKNKSIGNRVTIMITCSLTLLFFIGAASAYKLQKANMEYIFNQTNELLASYIERVDYVISDVDNLLYRIVTSNEIQQSGSALLDNEKKYESSAYIRQIEIANIMDQTRQIVSSNEAIISATFIDNHGNKDDVAITNYVTLPISTIEQIDTAARDAEGETIFMDVSDDANIPYTMIMARSIREKRNLSLEHIGTMILYVNIELLYKPVADLNGGSLVLYNDDYSIKYILNNNDDLTFEDLPTIEADSYVIMKIKSKTYFAIAPKKNNSMFNYALFTPYMTKFSSISHSFILFFAVYFLFLILAIIFGIHFSKRITKDLKSITAHMSSISQKDVAAVDSFDLTKLTDHDAIVMAEAFNTLGSHINELIEDNYKNEILIKETKLRVLQAQINPHFLYNTLNSLYWMAKSKKNDPAAQMISSLGILLREAISNEQMVVTVSKELDVLSHYFTIQKNRYENRLENIIRVCPDVENYIIPKFSLQPVVENAITYGLENMLDTCIIEIKICANANNTLICQVFNNGPAPEENLMEKLNSGQIQPKGHGIGLKNIDSRIKAIFGEEYGVSIGRENDRTVVTLTMECLTLNEYDMRHKNE